MYVQTSFLVADIGGLTGRLMHTVKQNTDEFKRLKQYFQGSTSANNPNGVVRCKENPGKLWATVESHRRTLLTVSRSSTFSGLSALARRISSRSGPPPIKPWRVNGDCYGTARHWKTSLAYYLKAFACSRFRWPPEACSIAEYISLTHQKNQWAIAVPAQGKLP